MRIRERLIALATASLTPSRPGQVPAGRGESMGELDAPAPPAAAELEAPSLPHSVTERMLQSIHTSQVRLLQTTEAIAMIASSVAHADAILRRRPLGLPTSAATAVSPPISELVRAAVEAANMRGADGSFLLVGANPSAAPFSNHGAFLGGSAATAMVTVPGPPPGLGVAAATLTAQAPSSTATPPPVDILMLLARAARTSGDPRAAAELHEGLTRAASQLAHLQSKIALALSVLSDAATIAEDMAPYALATLGEPAAVDAGALASTFGAIEAARSLAERTLAIFPLMG